ncbi:alpha/beta fold hydrolase [Pseudonocardia sp. CA-142604]|uniref:alpha/beta fold hydrolase n=1 Tax=Pseudonocardia sp. CA-142604 TaxID=3240024 RepID=UPI003D92349E
MTGAGRGTGWGHVVTVLELTGRPRTRDGISSRWTRVDELRMHARVTTAAPDGAPDVVLLHGLGVSSRYMLPLARELAPHFRASVPDLPGFGHSDHPPAALDVPGLADALLAWIDAAELTAPALVADSVGCQVAVAAMRRSPEAFGRAVLISPTVDRRGRNPVAEVSRLLRTGLHESPALAIVLGRDYLACGARRALATAWHALAHPIEDDLPEIEVPVLVVRGGADAVVPQRWAEEVAETLPDGRLAVLPGQSHSLSHSAAGPLAAAIGPFLGGPPPGPDVPTTRQAADSIAPFDSATVVLRAAATALHGHDLPALGAVPRPLAPLHERVLPLIDALPAPVREQVHRFGRGTKAVPPAELHAVSAEAVARWMVAQYPRRSYPVAIVGSTSGAMAHLAAALGAPFLPQTFLLPVARPDVGRDDPRGGMTAGIGPAELLLDANPEVALHHTHDPDQDRLSQARMTYFRLKRRRLGAAFTGFLTETLPPGATLLVADCRLRWPVTRLGDQHVFQFGASRGTSSAEFRSKSECRGWDVPPADEEAPEAEWGFDAALGDDLAALAAARGWRLRRVAFDEPAALSPLIADLYRWWYLRRGRPAQRLLVESFVRLDPHLALATGSVPYWSQFPVERSADALERYLDHTEPFDEILMTLFPPGTEEAVVAPAKRWRDLMGRARRRGAFLGIDPDAFSRDTSGVGRFHRELSALPRVDPPAPLTLSELGVFLSERSSSDEPPIHWE